MCPARRNKCYSLKQSSDLRRWKGYRNSSEDNVIYYHTNERRTIVTVILNGHEQVIMGNWFENHRKIR